MYLIDYQDVMHAVESLYKGHLGNCMDNLMMSFVCRTISTRKWSVLDWEVSIVLGMCFEGCINYACMASKYVIMKGTYIFEVYLCKNAILHVSHTSCQPNRLESPRYA